MDRDRNIEAIFKWQNQQALVTEEVGVGDGERDITGGFQVVS